jgi:hypothetical protein
MMKILSKMKKKMRKKMKMMKMEKGFPIIAI